MNLLGGGTIPMEGERAQLAEKEKIFHNSFPFE